MRCSCGWRGWQPRPRQSCSCSSRRRAAHRRGWSCGCPRWRPTRASWRSGAQRWCRGPRVLPPSNSRRRCCRACRCSARRRRPRRRRRRRTPRRTRRRGRRTHRCGAARWRSSACPSPRSSPDPPAAARASWGGATRTRRPFLRRRPRRRAPRAPRAALCHRCALPCPTARCFLTRRWRAPMWYR
jgi:hypothetical protein